jgi:hypothetical protein
MTVSLDIIVRVSIAVRAPCLSPDGQETGQSRSLLHPWLMTTKKTRVPTVCRMAPKNVYLLLSEI